MKQLLKIFILSVCFLCLVIGLVGCGDNSTPINTDRPVYQPEISETGEIKKAPKDYLNSLNVNGNFSTIKGIKKYVSGYKFADSRFGGDLDGGVKITASFDGACFYYTNILDLYDMTENIIEFEVLRNIADGSEDYSYVGGMEITLIDAYDSDNTVSVLLKENSGWQQSSYMLVSCNGAEYGRKNDDSTQDGDINKGESRPKTGTVIYTNGFAQILTQSHIPFGFRFDAAENQIWAHDRESSAEWMVLDVDDPVYMKNFPLFKGFTTGEVYLRITFTNVLQQGEVVITRIGGRDLSAADIATIPNENLIGLEMDYDYYRNNLTDGVVGYKYYLPIPTEYDEIMGVYKVNSNVTYDGQDCSSLIQNGVLVPDKTGTYVITYSATDANGLSVSRVFDLNVTSESLPISITLSDVAGEDYELFSWINAPTVNMSGGNGKLKEQTVEYYYNGNKISLNRDGKFYASELGVLEIDASATDELGQVICEKFTKNINGVRDLTLKSYVPYGFEKGKDFVIPDFSAVDYTSGTPREMAKSVYVNGVGKDVGDIVKMEDSELVIDFYGDKGTSSEIRKTYSLKPINGAKVQDLAGAFVVENGTVSQDRNVVFNFNTTDNAIKMPYAVSADYANVRISADKDNMNFDYIDVRLEDSLFGQSVIVRFLYESGKTYLALKDNIGDFSLKYELSVNMQDGANLNFYYVNSDHSILSGSNAKIADVLYDSEGQPFVGFDSLAIKISVSAGKISGSAPSGKINLHSIGNQSFSYTVFNTGDTTAPELAIRGNLPSRQRVSYNSVFTLPHAYAYDVLQYQSTLNVKVMSPSGAVVYESAGEGIDLRLSEIGNYLIRYNLIDEFGNKNKYDYYIETVDDTAPVITVTGNYNEEYRLGESIKNLSYDVSDNYSDASAIKVYVFVIDTSFATTDITGKDYVFMKQGYYKIVYYAVDAAGNVGMEIRQVFAW